LEDVFHIKCLIYGFSVLSGPIPEKPISTSDCRKNLLEEIEDGLDNLEARINLFEAKTSGWFS